MPTNRVSSTCGFAVLFSARFKVISAPTQSGRTLLARGSGAFVGISGAFVEAEAPWGAGVGDVDGVAPVAVVAAVAPAL